ncbi:MAG TPA: BTAD domain-containing putative transcriptional regulator [Gaiellaceae bacterium]|nr:BTAD domain-containing putative transcriptional regulator [Gaiellaceae bacterium]
MEFRILGPLEVVEGGQQIALGTLKERLVLGVLLLHANEFVSRERLIDDLWGEAPPPTARKAVNVYVSKVRKTLSAAGADPLTTAPGGYRLLVDPGRLDVGRMHRLVASARECVGQGELETAAERFREALSLWRGPTLAGLQLESRGRDEIAQLDELRLAVLMDRLDCDLALGWHEQALGELGVLVSEHPLRERLRAQQMLALYRAGRQAEALEAYAEARRTLVDDLGIEPSEGLQRLQQGILRHDPSLETPTGTTAINGAGLPAVPAEGPVPAALPAQLRSRRRGLRRRYLVVAGLAAVAAVVAVVSTGGASHRRYTIAYVTPSVGEDIVQSIARGSREAAKRLGVRYILTGGTYQATIARHVDAIISQGYDPVLTPIFAKVRKAGILLISSGDDIAGKRDLWVSQSGPVEYGRALADALASQIHDKGEYAILEQQDQYPIGTTWKKVVKAYIAEAYPNMKLDGVIDGTGAGDQTEIDSVKSFISAHPHLKGLIGITPTEAYMAADAITQAGKIGRIFSAGNGDDSLGDTPLPNFVRSGAAELVYVSNPVKLGYLTVWAAKYLLTGHHFRPGVAYQVGGPIGLVWYYPKHRELRLGQPLTITKANVNLYANKF